MFLFCLVFAMPLCASIYMCFVVTCWERADLALVCGVCCEFDTFPLVSWVRCGTWLYRFLIFAPLLTLKMFIFIKFETWFIIASPSQSVISREYKLSVNGAMVAGSLLGSDYITDTYFARIVTYIWVCLKIELFHCLFITLFSFLCV